MLNEHPKAWAVGPVVLSLLWLFGFGSVMGAVAGAYVLTGEGPPGGKRVAGVAAALGAIGLGIALLIAIRPLA